MTVDRTELIVNSATRCSSHGSVWAKLRAVSQVVSHDVLRDRPASKSLASKALVPMTEAARNADEVDFADSGTHGNAVHVADGEIGKKVKQNRHRDRGSDEHDMSEPKGRIFRVWSVQELFQE